MKESFHGKWKKILLWTFEAQSTPPKVEAAQERLQEEILSPILLICMMKNHTKAKLKDLAQTQKALLRMEPVGVGVMPEN